jgi:lipopolysaccharide assembly outer membrane protein LptD (OstA)
VIRPILALLATAALALSVPALAEESPPPPLNIAADNVTGSHDEAGDVVLLNGHVHITRGRTVLTAQSGRYVRAEGRLDLHGEVKMVDSTTTLTCDDATYSEKTDLLQVSGNVTIVDREGTLHAPAGTYDRKTGRIDLTGGVDGTDRDQKLTCDNATYDRDSMVVHARGDVKGMDEKNRIELNARSIDYNRRTREAIATGDPVMKSRDEKDRVAELRAITLKVNTETRMAEAIDSVTVVRDTLRGRADYALFDDNAGRGWLYGRPRVWDDQTEVSGDTLELWSEKRVLNRVRVRGHALMNYKGTRPTTLGESSELSGDIVDVYFRNEEIDSLVAVGSARNLYGGQPRPGKASETNLAIGDTITVFFKDRKVELARVQGKASGEYHPSVTLGDTTAARKEVVNYDATRIEFMVPKNRIVLENGAHLTYSDLELRARKVAFDVDDQTLVAEGNPQLFDKGDQVTGHLMTYDLRSRVGTIYKAETAYEKGLYHGERIRKVGDNVLDVLNGSYSTCDLPEPHYHFSSHYMKIYLRDKLVAKPVVFYLRHVPLLALPFYVFPIKPGRHSGFLFPQFEFGFNNRAGQFLRNAGYYWAPNDYMDLTGSGDYYQAEPSWVMRAEGNYRLLYKLNGDFAGTFAKNDATRREDYDFNMNHSQDLSPRTRLVARGQFVSSKDYNSSNLYGRPLSQRLNRFLVSSFAVSHAADWASFNAVVDRRQDLDADGSIADPDGEGPLHGPPVGVFASLANLTEHTPDLRISFPTRTLGTFPGIKGTPFGKALQTMYFAFDTHFLSQREQRAFVAGYRGFLRDSVPDSTTVLAQQVTTRRALASNISLSDSRRLFGWLNLSPRVNSNAVVFDYDEQGHKVVPVATWSGSVTSSATFYGSFQPHIGRLVGIRHVVFPSVSFNYSPQFESLTFRDSLGQLRNRFTGFGGIGVSGFRNSSMSFSLDQRIQAKLKHGDQVQRLDNLLSLSLASSYDFLWKDKGLRHPLSPIGASLFLQPPGLLNASVGGTIDPYEGRPLRALSGSTGFSLASGGGRPAVAELPVDQTQRKYYEEVAPEFRESWSLSLAYSYAGGYESPNWSSRQTANAVARYDVTPNWSLDYSASYDITLRNVLTQRFGVSRTLHCWIATFTRTFTPGGEAEYYFRLGIKDQREVYMERGTRVGSIGGIN